MINRPPQLCMTSLWGRVSRSRKGACADPRGDHHQNPLQHKSHHILHRFQYFVLLHSTTSHHKYWIYQIIYKAKPIRFVIKPYTNHNTLWVKHATHQKAESLRTVFPSNLDNMVNNRSNFNAKYAEFCTK